MGVLSLVWLGPFVWMLSTALKPNARSYMRPLQWIPIPPTIENFETVLISSRSASILRAFMNSSVVTVSTVLLVLFVATLAAYVLARWDFRGRNLIFIIILSALMVPQEVTLVPLFLLMFKLGWINTYQALIVPGVATPFAVFLLRQFFLTLPSELEDASRIDGCNRFMTLVRIFLPLVKPALATVTVFTFLGTWNDFTWPLIAMTDTEMMTLPVALTVFQSAYGNLEMGTVMAASFFASVPTLLMFVLAQRWIVQGIVLSGLKA